MGTGKILIDDFVVGETKVSGKSCEKNWLTLQIMEAGALRTVVLSEGETKVSGKSC